MGKAVTKQSTESNMMQQARAAAQAMGKRSDLWSPDPGVYHVRVLEPLGDMTVFFAGFPLHWGFGDPVVCPRRLFGSGCPICAMGGKLADAGETEAAKKYWPSWSAYMNILLVDEDGDPVPDAEGEAQVKVWRVGRDTLTDIFNAIEEDSPSVDQLINITDAKEGVDLRVKRTGTLLETKWGIRCAKHGPTSIEDYREAWEPKMVDCSGYLQVHSAEELASLLTSSQDPFTAAAAQVAVGSGSGKKQLKAPGKTRVAKAEVVADDGGDDVVVPQDDDDEDEKPSSGRAKLSKLLKNNKGNDDD